MAWYEWIFSILLFVISLGALITIHEAGHLSMAKLFKVYCHEFSVGFGPALLHKRKEGRETYFSIRAIPFGGYVSMYGEENTELEEFKDVPANRSLEGIKKWKKAIVVSAGVILNALLALLLIGISNFAFPTIVMTTRSVVESGSVAEAVGIEKDSRLTFVLDESHTDGSYIKPYSYYYEDNSKVIHAGNFYIVDPNATIENGKHYVLAFMFQGDKGNPSFAEGLKLYQSVTREEIVAEYCEFSHVQEMFKDWALSENSPDYYPNFERNPYKFDSETKINTSVTFTDKDDNKTVKDFVFDCEDGKIKDIGLAFATAKQWDPIGTRAHNTFIQYGEAASAVFKGIGMLFTGGIRNMSGIVGIFETSASLYRNYTFATYLYFWGLISVNLAIFNLLPFPGLDGWQLLVTAIEGITKKKLPNKFKSIMSLIGLGLLFVLMIVVIVFDIGRIVGV